MYMYMYMYTYTLSRYLGLTTTQVSHCPQCNKISPLQHNF